MLEEVGKGFRRGNTPEMLFPRGDKSTDFFIRFERVLETGADVAAVDAGDPSGIGIVGAGKAGERLGENSRGIRIGRWNALLHEVLKAAAEDRKNGEGAVGEEEIAKDLQPDDHKFDGVFTLEGLGITDERERTAGGKGVMESLVGFHFAERGFEAGGQAGELVPGTVADAEDDDAGREPVGIPPMGVGFGVEAEVHPKIDVGNDGVTKFPVSSLGRTDFLEGGGEVIPSLGGIGRITGPGATSGELGGGGGQVLGRRASTAFQSTKLRNSSM